MAEKITINDLLRFRFPGNLQYNPEGTVLAFQVKRSDEKKNTYRNDVWIAEGDEARQLTSSMDASVVTWLDNEQLLINRSTEEAQPGMTELFVINIHGGEAKPFAKVPLMLGTLKEIGDGLYAASAMINAEDPDAWKDTAEERKAKAEKLQAEKDYTVVDEVPYWFNGRGYTNKKRTALFTISFTPEVKIRRITKPMFEAGDFLVQGKKIWYTGNTKVNRRSLTNKVYVYDTETKKTETVYGKNDMMFSKLLMFGNTLYALASDGKEYGINETSAFWKIGKNTAEKILKPEYGLHSSVGGDLLGGARQQVQKENVFYTLATEEDHTVVYRYDEHFTLEKIFDQSGAVSGIDVGKDRIAVLREDAVTGPELYTLNMQGEDLRRLTHLNDEVLKDKYIAVPHRIDYESEGDSLHGWVLLPENYSPKKKYPAVLDIHGGPRTVYGVVFFHVMQVWAAKGYVVFFTNIRGSDGRGDAFADLRGKYGYVDYRQLMAFTDAVLQAYPNIDPKKVCETGGSYGGFMTNWIITHTDRFCCAASQRSISNWVSFSFISDIGLYFGPDQCGAENLYLDTEDLWEHSPLKYADQVKTPTLFIHSDEDYRCPLPEGMQMMQALANRNVETRMVIFHGENHELSRSGKPLHRIRRLQEITDWFDKHTK